MNKNYYNKKLLRKEVHVFLISIEETASNNEVLSY